MKAEALKPFYNKTFCIEELQNYFKQPIASIRMQLSRLCKTKKLIRLKKNCYTFTDFSANAFKIGQEMVSPSYYSLESILSLHGIIPEGPAMHTLITSKKTQTYTNGFGTFNYRHLPPHLFFGVEQESDGIWRACSEKALLDYLYLNSRKFKSDQVDFGQWQAERFDNLETLDWEKMNEWAPLYRMKKLEFLVKNLKKYTKSKKYQAHK